MKRYFVTGTGTGVGKTFVTCALARLARDRGLNVVAHKPIETGCPMLDGRRQGEDQRALLAASSPWLATLDDGEVQYGSYQFTDPVAPAVAAEREGVEIDFARIGAVLGRAGRTPKGEPIDVLVVEGAGGWRVPISDRADMGDLARLVRGEIIVVGTAGLGTINHSLLTLEAVIRDGFEVAALVLSNLPNELEAMVQSNVEEIQKRWPGRLLLVNDLEQLLPFHVEHEPPRETL
jgi:dethiobiotin synthetase